MKRLEFSRKILAASHARAAGRCEKCGAALKVGEGEGDHILPAALGGEPTLANLQILCTPCHREKSANDIKGIRKADRARDRQTGALRAKGPGFKKIPKPGAATGPINKWSGFDRGPKWQG